MSSEKSLNQPHFLKKLNSEPLKLFYAEDIEAERKLFQIALDESDISSQLILAADGEKALDFLLTNLNYTPDLVLLDLKMPYKDGHELLQELRSHARFNHTPIIILSASISDEDIDRAYANGASLYIQKPMGLDDFVALIKKICNIEWDIYKAQSSRRNFLLTTAVYQD